MADDDNDWEGRVADAWAGFDEDDERGFLTLMDQIGRAHV